MDSLTGHVVRFARGLELSDVPVEARRVARTAILDTLACAVGGGATRVAGAVRSFAAEEGTAPRATIWGTGLRTAPSRAALANGAAAHALDFDDVSWAMNGHPSAPLLPAVLAVAEDCGASGEETLVAYVAGFEVEARLGAVMGLGHYSRGWHPTATLGTLGATVAAGLLRGLDEDAFRRALGIACSTLAGTRMNFGTDTKPLHAGFAAQAGVLAADLAARGITACPEPLDAEMGPADLYDGTRPTELPRLGEPFALVDPGVEFKPYPSCRFTHRLIDGVLAVRDRHGSVADATIRCVVNPFAHRICIHPRPTDGLQAKFSLPYCAAVAWLDGWPSVASFTDERAVRDDVQALLRRVEMEDAAGPTEEVVVRFASGEEDREEVRYARGHPSKPINRGDHVAKVRALCAPVLGEEGTGLLVDAVDGIEKLAAVSALSALLVPEGSR
jgi:2-methylcitrate dehydratase PrpD